MDSLEAHVILARAPGLSRDHLDAMARAYGSVHAALSRPPATLSVDPPLNSATVDFLQTVDPAQTASDLQWVQKAGAQVLSALDSRYPEPLLHITRPPPFLFVLGSIESLATPQLAIVGARNPTASGRATAREFSSYFSVSGLTITSGLALGIDTAAHEGALDHGGPTIAVCGTGLDIVYPRQNLELARRIERSGAVISEFPPGTLPLRPNFPQRNRIISGLALGTLVVEAARHSGSLITAGYALAQGREVFAIPGSIHNPLSRGCHKLIQDGAKLVEAASDVLLELKFSLRDQLLGAQKQTAAGAAVAPGQLDKEYEILLDALGFEPASVDELTATSGFSGESVASMLLILELEGRVAPQPGGRYCRVPQKAPPNR